MIQTLLLVGAGGALGAMARHLAGLAALRLFGAAFPAGTLAVNVLGSVLIGVLAVALAGRAAGPAWFFLVTGVLGGFTTFSAFSLDAMRLWQAGQGGVAALYVAASVGLSLAGVLAGAALARGWAA